MKSYCYFAQCVVRGKGGELREQAGVVTVHTGTASSRRVLGRVECLDGEGLDFLARLILEDHLTTGPAPIGTVELVPERLRRVAREAGFVVSEDEVREWLDRQQGGTDERTLLGGKRKQITRAAG